MRQFSDKTNNFDFFGPNLPKNGFLVGNSKTNVEIRISILRYHVCQFVGKMDNSDFFGPNLPKNGFMVWKFRKLMKNQHP